MPGIQDMVWYLVVLTFTSLNLFSLYSLHLKIERKRADSAKIIFLVVSIIILTACCLWLKSRNDAVWRALIELIRMQTNR